MDSKKVSQKEIDVLLEDHLKRYVLASDFLGIEGDKLEDFISKCSDITKACANTMMVEDHLQIIRPESELPAQFPKHFIELAFKFQFIVNPDDALQRDYKYLSLYVPDEEYEKALLDKPKYLKQVEQKGKTGDEADSMATALATYPLALDSATGQPKELGDLNKDTEQFVAVITQGKYTLEILREFLSMAAKEHKKNMPSLP